MPTFQPFSITVDSVSETFNDIDMSNGVFTYRKSEAGAPLSTLPKITASLTRPSIKGNYYVSRINLLSPSAVTIDGVTSIRHTNYGFVELKVHRDATEAEAAAHTERFLAILASADLNAMLSDLVSLR